MLDDGFNMLLAKFSQDAKQEIKDHQQKTREAKRQAEASRRLYRRVKFFFLCIALIGVGVGLYFSKDLGSLAGEMSLRTPDPTLRAERKPTVKQKQMSELRREREQDLEEIQN